jgi:hypothetical protein
MSIRVRGGAPMQDVPAGTICFYCHHEITAWAMFWMGAFDLWLHPQCQIELDIRMKRDIHELERKTGFYVAPAPWREGGGN